MPREETQFTSTNQPANRGRPKGSKTIKLVLKEILSNEDPEGEWARPIVKKLLQKAFIDNDLKALQEVIDRIEGKQPIVDQSTHVTEIKYGWSEVKDSNRLPPTEVPVGDSQRSDAV